MKSRKTQMFLLMGTFSLLMLHLWKDIADPERIIIQEEVKEYKQATEIATHTSNVFSWKLCIRNLSAADMTNFHSLPVHIQDFLYYRHCRRFRLLLDVPDKCGGAEHSAEVFLLLVIKSSPGNYDRREVLRKTWAKERQHNGVWIRRVFISGTTETGLEKEYLNHLLKLEQKEYNDIIQWDFTDTFFNLTVKQILFLEWMEKNCPRVRFLLNGDDDVFANTDNMVEYLQALTDNDGSKHLFVGHLIQSAKPFRSPGSKYYIPVQVYEPDKYPPYCGGGGYLLSGHTARVIYVMSKFTTIIPIDDVYMGMCLAKAGLSPTLHRGVKTLRFHTPSKKSGHYNLCVFREILLVHRFDTGHIFHMWEKLHEPNLKCGYVDLIKAPTSSSKTEIMWF